MAQISGKFIHDRNENYYEFLVKNGIPPETAKKIDESKPTVTSHFNGDKFTVEFQNTISGNQIIQYTLNKEIDEVINTVPLKSVATIEGDILTISSRTLDGKSGKRIYKFTDFGVEAILISDEGGQARRFYKRL